MKILILTVGTQGDVRPYVALGKGLIEAGHEVTICTCAKFEAFVKAHGVAYAWLNNDLLDLMNTEDGRLAMENTDNIWQAIRTGIKLFPKIKPMMHRQIDEMWQAAEAFQPDLILFHKKALGAEDFAEKLKIPCALAFYLPLYAATSEFPAMGFPRWSLGGWYNRLTYRIIDWVTRLSTGKFIRPWRKAHGLPARGKRYSRANAQDTVPMLHAFSPSVIPEPSDWPDTATVTGYWFLDESHAGWVPPPELIRFLSAEPPPIYVGFGSIFGRNPKRTARTIVDAIKQADVRAIIATGWGGLDVSGIDLPDSIIEIESAPHDWLFPRVAAVVHHGGCGTTAAGLRAGKPTIICPFFGDQPFWGEIVYRLGAGPAPVPQKKLTAEKLAEAIRKTLEDGVIAEKANALGEKIRGEDGVGSAARFIEANLTR